MIIERLHLLDTIPHAALVVECVLGGPTSKVISLASSAQYDAIGLGLILLLKATKLVTGHAKEGDSYVVKARQPYLASMITSSNLYDVPVLRLLVTAITLLTSPAIMRLYYLLVALRRGASRIHHVLGFDVHDGGAHREEISLVGHAKLRVLDLVNREHLIAVDCPARPR